MSLRSTGAQCRRGIIGLLLTLCSAIAAINGDSSTAAAAVMAGPLLYDATASSVKGRFDFENTTVDGDLLIVNVNDVTVSVHNCTIRGKVHVSGGTGGGSISVTDSTIVVAPPAAGTAAPPSVLVASNRETAVAPNRSQAAAVAVHGYVGGVLIQGNVINITSTAEGTDTVGVAAVNLHVSGDAVVEHNTMHVAGPQHVIGFRAVGAHFIVGGAVLIRRTTVLFDRTTGLNNEAGGGEPTVAESSATCVESLPVPDTGVLVWERLHCATASPVTSARGVVFNRSNGAEPKVISRGLHLRLMTVDGLVTSGDGTPEVGSVGAAVHQLFLVVIVALATVSVGGMLYRMASRSSG